MYALTIILKLAHLIGLALGLGSATVKIALLLRCNRNYNLYPDFIKASKPVTRLLISGIILLVLSGTGWLITGYPLTTLMIIKIILVVLVFASGAVIDNVVEPTLKKLLPTPGESPTQPFIQIQKRHLLLEIAATMAMYAITVIGVFL